MSELITSRITAHATRLGLPHLAENLALLVERAEADNMGYREFIDTVLGEELGLVGAVESVSAAGTADSALSLRR